MSPRLAKGSLAWLKAPNESGLWTLGALDKGTMHTPGWQASEMKCRLSIVEPMQREAGDPIPWCIGWRKEKDSGDGVTSMEPDHGKRESGRNSAISVQGSKGNPKSPLRTEVKGAEPHTLVSPSCSKELEGARARMSPVLEMRRV